MPKGKVVGRIRRKEGCMYFVDGKGAVREMSRKRSKKRSTRKRR